MMRDAIKNFDFMPIGQKIKAARLEAGLTREQLSEQIGCVPRHLQAIENEGQYPSLPLLIELVSMFHISVDQYIFPESNGTTSAVRQQLDLVLDSLNDAELSVVLATAKGLQSMRMSD